MKIWICIVLVGLAGGVALNERAGALGRLQRENDVFESRVGLMEDLRRQLGTKKESEIDLVRLETLRAEMPELLRLRSEVGKLRSIEPTNLEGLRERLKTTESSLASLKEEEAKLARIAWGLENHEIIENVGWTLSSLYRKLAESGIKTVPTTVGGFEQVVLRIERFQEFSHEWDGLVRQLKVYQEKTDITLAYFELPSSIVPEVLTSDQPRPRLSELPPREVLAREREPRMLYGGGWGRFYLFYPPGYSRFGGIDVNDVSLASEEYRDLAEEMVGRTLDEEALEAVDPKDVFALWESKQDW